MTSVLTRASAVVASVVLVCQLPQAAQPESPSALDLAAFFADAGGVVRDTNDDGIADSVAARVIVPATPTREDSLAAANIAGRLGFETSSLSLPLVLRDGDVRQPAGIEVPILVGRNNSFTAKLVEQGQIAVNTLQPGQGLIAAVASPLGGGAGLVVVGADDEGTLAAGTELAARLPRLWNMTGITLAGISDQVSRHLRGAGIEARQGRIFRCAGPTEKIK